MPHISDFTLTTHAITRLIDRDTEFAKNISKDCAPVDLRRKAYDYIKDATENKSFINNTVFMNKLYFKYGFNKHYNFFELDNLVFVGIIDEKGTVIVTVLSKNDCSTPHLKRVKKKWIKKDKENCEFDVGLKNTHWPKGYGVFGSLGKGRR